MLGCPLWMSSPFTPSQHILIVKEIRIGVLLSGEHDTVGCLWNSVVSEHCVELVIGSNWFILIIYYVSLELQIFSALKVKFWAVL